MPWRVSNNDGRWCVTKEGDDSPLKCYDSRTDAIKYQRALYANESRSDMVAAITYEEPEPELDPRLLLALARLEELSEKEKAQGNSPVNITLSPDQSVTRELLAALDQITARLADGERFSESLVASLVSLTQQPPVVNVEAPIVNVPETVVNLPAPIVNIEPPVVNVPETVVNVPAPLVTVNMPDRAKKVTFERDPLTGQVTTADVTEA